MAAIYCEGLNGHPAYPIVMIELSWISLALSANLVFGCVSHTRKCAGSSTIGLRQQMFGPPDLYLPVSMGNI